MFSMKREKQIYFFFSGKSILKGCWRQLFKNSFYYHRTSSLEQTEEMEWTDDANVKHTNITTITINIKTDIIYTSY